MSHRTGCSNARDVMCLAGAVRLLILLTVPALAAAEAPAPQRIRTILGGEYWGTLPSAEYRDYLAKVRPDVIHGSVLGPELASVVHTRGERKCITPAWPADVGTMKEYHDWWQDVLKEVHDHGVKVQATFSMVNAWGDRAGNEGWFKYYNDLWEEELLGPRPCPDSADMFECDADGNLLPKGSTGWTQYRGCVNNPHWRQALKQMVRAGVEAGFDGFMVQFPHARGDCACEYCQAKFREFLRGRYSPDVLRRKFGIRDLDRHVFEGTGPRPGMPGPIDVEAREFAAISVKECLDEVFIDYGRKLKPDLIVSVWTHFRQFLTEGLPTAAGTFVGINRNTSFEAYIDERALLPIEMWGRGEDYLWYSNPIYKSNLKDKLLGDATLGSKFMRAMASGTPFVAQKYDYFRWRLTTMEPVALGGASFGAWQGGWSGGIEREEVHLLTYFNFIRSLDRHIQPRESYAEVALVFPRTALYWGDCGPLEPFRRLGRGLIGRNILFDVLIDEKITAQALARYRAVLLPATKYLSASQRRLLDGYAAAGGTVLVLPGGAPEDGQGRTVLQADLDDKEAVGEAVAQAVGDALSEFDAPWTVLVNADRNRVRRLFLVHFVNYNRDETRDGERAEAPIPAGPVGVDLQLPGDEQVTRVHFLTPEIEGEQDLEFAQQQGRLRFTTPGFLVYGLAVVECE